MTTCDEVLVITLGVEFSLLRHCREGQSVFFTGSAGTGKSLLLKHILRALPKDSTFVTASTGLAAAALGGITINAFAGFSLCLAATPLPLPSHPSFITSAVQSGSRLWGPLP